MVAGTIGIRMEQVNNSMNTEIIDNTTLQFLESKYGIVGHSPLMIEVVQRLLKVAPTNLTVLITGETGTGKEVFAQAIHGLSNRKKFPFVSVNCGAIPETLLESELFGHEKGAFTGAVDQRKGFFEVANKGTIFLDEIGEMPISTQVKLLRILESGEFSRLGSSDIHKVDVRIVTATNRDLEYEVRNGRFRQDLYFRLNSVPIKLPALRKHPEDIPLLASYFANKVSTKNGHSFIGFTQDALHLLQEQPWQGNIRELRNTIETVVTLEQGFPIDSSTLKKHLRTDYQDQATMSSDRSIIVHSGYQTHTSPLPLDSDLIFRTLIELRSDISDIKRALAAIFEKIAGLEMQAERASHQSIHDLQIIHDTSHQLQHEPALHSDSTLEDMEKFMIQASLQKHDGNRRLAAKALGISERTLYRKIIDYKLTDQIK